MCDTDKNYFWSKDYIEKRVFQAEISVSEADKYVLQSSQYLKKLFISEANTSYSTLLFSLKKALVVKTFVKSETV